MGGGACGRRPARETSRNRILRTSASKTKSQAVAPEPRLGIREQNKIDKYNRILAAGKALFNERGYEATTTQAIAEVAGVGAGTFFAYFATKEDLLIAVFMGDLTGAVNSSYRTARDKTGLLERTFTLFNGLMQYHAESISLSRHLVRELVYVTTPDTRQRIAELMITIKNNVMALVADEQAAGSYSTAFDNELLASNCFGIYYDVLQKMLNGRESVESAPQTLRSRLDLQISPLYVK